MAENDDQNSGVRYRSDTPHALLLLKFSGRDISIDLDDEARETAMAMKIANSQSGCQKLLARELRN